MLCRNLRYLRIVRCSSRLHISDYIIVSGLKVLYSQKTLFSSYPLLSNTLRPIKQLTIQSSPTMKMDKDGNGILSFSQARSVETSSTSSSSSSTKEPNFPAKLHAILSNPEYEDIVSWFPHGRSFRILRLQEFEERILPKYFRHGRYPSFTRQLNGWGFHRVNEGPEYNSHYHELFVRGRPDFALQMKRLTSADMTERRKPERNTSSPPDFYKMPCVPSFAPEAQPQADGPSEPSERSTSIMSQRLVPLERELAMLEQRRAKILEQMKDLTGAGTLQPLHRQYDISLPLGFFPGLFPNLHDLNCQSRAQDTYGGVAHILNDPALSAKRKRTKGEWQPQKNWNTSRLY
jgi:hypothetical protein